MNSLSPEVMEIGVPKDSEWLRPLIGTTQFHKECAIHHKPCNRFCIKCIAATPYCEMCASNSHRDHQILVVYKASRSHALRAEDMDGLLDTSHIHRFSFNKHNVIFIKSRKSDDVHTNRKEVASKCVTCGWEISKNSKFCSFGCKLENSARSTTSTTLKVKVDKKSFRKRSRKGIPKRSFF